MIHFVHQWRKWLILSQKSAESISGLVVETSELISETFLERTAVRSKTSELISVFRAQRAKHQSVCQEDAAILASCRNYFLKRPTNRDIFKLLSQRSCKLGHFQIVYRSVPAFVVTLTIASKRKAQRS